MNRYLAGYIHDTAVTALAHSKPWGESMAGIGRAYLAI